jgi:lactoylglutathione lyase
MRTLHVGLRVNDRHASMAFYASIGYEVVGEVPETSFGHLTMLKLPADEFVTLELVHDPDSEGEIGTGLSHLVIRVESMEIAMAALAEGGITVEEPTSPSGSDDFLTSWLTDPDGRRIELVQWPPGLAPGCRRPTSRKGVADALGGGSSRCLRPLDRGRRTGLPGHDES